MLVELAVGDAYGAGFEYANPGFVLANNKVKRYIQHPKHKIAPGSYTDDTQMTIANMEVICTGEVTREALADSYVNCFKRDPREGYAGRFYQFLSEVKDGTEFLAKIRPDSDKSGAAMRALPFAIYSDINLVKKYTQMQAEITHNTPGGINSALVVALMGHYFLYKLGPKADLDLFIQKHVKGNWGDYTGSVGSKGWMSVRAAITAIKRSSDYTQLLRECVAFTGDVDTVAAIAMGAASLSEEFNTSNVPLDLLEDLEPDSDYGLEFLNSLDLKWQTKAS